MIKLTSVQDLKHLEENTQLPNAMKEYLKDYVKEMLSRFQSESLENFGSIFVLENFSDAENYTALGFHSPMDTEKARCFLNVALIENGTAFGVTQLIFFQDNFATIIFAKDNVLIAYEKQMKKEAM